MYIGKYNFLNGLLSDSFEKEIRSLGYMSGPKKLFTISII